MGLLLPISGPGYECKRYTGSDAERLFAGVTVDVERAAHDSSRDDMNLLALFWRHNGAGRQETGIFYCPEDEPSELLRFFSNGQEGYEAAQTLYSELLEETGFEECLVGKDYELESQQVRKRYGCCKCGGSALWELVRTTAIPDAHGMAQSLAVFACNEHMEEALRELNETKGGGWQSRFVEDEDDNSIELLPPGAGE